VPGWILGSGAEEGAERAHRGWGLLRAIVVTHSYLAALDPGQLYRSPFYI